MPAPTSSPTNYWVQTGSGKNYLSWDIYSGATGYSVQRSTDGVSYTTLASPTANEYLDTAVTINTRYYYQVAAVNGSGTGPYTTAQSVVPTLPGKTSLGALRLQAQQRADRVNSGFLTLPEWNLNINQSYAELYDLLITAYEDYYVAPRLTFTTSGTQTDYDLPNGQNYAGAPALYKLYGVDLGLDSSNNAFMTLRKFDFLQRNQYVFPQLTSTILGVFNLQYRMLGERIRFIPLPSAGQPVGLWYFPRLTALLSDTDVMDGISGWDEYVIVDAAIKALQKEESDVSVLMAQKQALIARIQGAAANRDAGAPDTISDVRRRGWGDGEGWGGWNGPIGGI